MKMARTIIVVFAVFFGVVTIAFCQSDRIHSKFPQQPPTQTINPQEILGQPFLDIKIFSASSNTVEYGQEVTLKWTIKGRNMKNLKLELSPGIGDIPLSRTDYTNEDFTIEGSKTIRPSQTQQYTLKVSGIAPGTLGPQRGTGPGGLPGVGEKTFTYSKSLTINVKKVVLENEKPEVDQKKMKIKFIVKNTGNADFKGPLSLAYIVKTLSGNELISGTYGVPQLSINAGGKFVYEINIPDRQKALNEDGIVIKVSIAADIHHTKSDLMSPPSSIIAERHTPSRTPNLREVDSDTYEHRWELKRLIINNELINTFGGLLTGSLRLNNFDGSKGAVLGHEPFKGNDCYIDIMGRRHNFTLNRFEFTKYKIYDYRGYINDMKANFSGRDVFSIENGTLKLTIRFETKGVEIKGYEETMNVFHDLTAPDYNFTKFNIYVYFGLGINNGTLTYKNVWVRTEVKGEFIGAYDALLPDHLADYIDRRVMLKLSGKIEDLFMSDYIKSKIDQKIEEHITRNPLFKIFRLVNVKGEGDSIVLEYIEN